MKTRLYAMPDTSASPNARTCSRARCPEEQQELPGHYLWGSREDDAPVRAGILASFEPEGEAFVTYVTPDEDIMDARN